jgi:tetratricopeptide (TPR) repeat protein
LAFAHQARGVLLRKSKPIEAERSLRTAINILRGLLRAQPTSSALRSNLNMVYLALANHHIQQDQVLQASRVLEAALAVLLEHRDESMDSLLSSTYANLGLLMFKTGRTAEAGRCWRNALPLAEKRANLHPEDEESLHQLGVIYGHLGELAVANDKPDQAKSYHQRTIEVRTALVQNNPAVPRYRRELVQALLDLGKVHRNQNHFQEAVRLFSEGQKTLLSLLQEAQPTPETLILESSLNCHLSLTLLDLDRPNKAMRSAEQAREMAVRAQQAAPDDHWTLHAVAVAAATRGKVLEKAGQFDQAILCYQEAIRDQSLFCARCTHSATGREILDGYRQRLLQLRIAQAWRGWGTGFGKARIPFEQ